MKLKEIPSSVYHTLRLASKSLSAFKFGKKPVIPVVISLTSIPSRLSKLHIVIRCLMDQTVHPEKIVLWLHEDMKSSLPNTLTALQGDLFEIHFTHLHCSHKKLIHTIPLFPEKVVVTCDDDFIYDANWLISLYEEHLQFPKDIVANHVRTISYDEHGNLLNYKMWVYDGKKDTDSHRVLAIGGKGVLYPPHALDSQYGDEVLFLKLAPKADDLWFKAMEILKGTRVRLSSRIVPEPIPIAGTQKISLKKENVDEDKNSRQWAALEEYFNFSL